MISAIAISLFVFAVIMSVWAWYSEKRDWNNGVCLQTGEYWKYFDMDSQGGRGYRSGEYVVWISHPGIDPKDRRYRDDGQPILGNSVQSLPDKHA